MNRKKCVFFQKIHLESEHWVEPKNRIVCAHTHAALNQLFLFLLFRVAFSSKRRDEVSECIGWCTRAHTIISSGAHNAISTYTELWRALNLSSHSIYFRSSFYKWKSSRIVCLSMNWRSAFLFSSRWFSLLRPFSHLIYLYMKSHRIGCDKFSQL